MDQEAVRELSKLADDMDFALESTRGEYLDQDGTKVSLVVCDASLREWEIILPNGHRFILSLRPERKK